MYKNPLLPNKTKLYCNHCGITTWWVEIDGQRLICCGDFKRGYPGCGTTLSHKRANGLKE